MQTIRHHWQRILFILSLLGLLLALWPNATSLYDLTGEEETLPQLRGVMHWINTAVRAGAQPIVILRDFGVAELDTEQAISFSIWGRDRTKAETLANQLSSQGIKAESVENLEQAVRSARIIITTTPSVAAL